MFVEIVHARDIWENKCLTWCNIGGGLNWDPIDKIDVRHYTKANRDYYLAYTNDLRWRQIDK